MSQGEAARLTLIGGPTASGKSARALELAERTGAVIINADSQQLYAGLRVLSARPDAEEEARAEHRLYGVAAGDDPWSVGRWVRAVEDLLDEIGGRPAVLVGGTGLYFTALTRGLADIPPVPDAVRQAVEADYDRVGETAFRQRLAGVDPEAAARIEANDRQRLIRAMAVATHTGRALSDWQADTRPILSPGRWTGQLILPEREALYTACDARCAVMLERGALGEVRALMDQGLSPALPVMKAVGVRELAAHLRGETSREEALAQMRQATRNYAKRQLTWFRNQMPDWERI
ncbi:tRNA (adenosine(37)-N6)-dimethylallyltransferase MiaA [Brevundimonas sp.]|uniref:tRNA (adenosine(37)-N6)-dimethylallyltransferase MiaA n=1 Tax=Brevundimonas sp. TaxID=1871086 RepID=UPI001DC3FA25|nr:tRNA (adenosine(37)-N6)-dimethylallyltransferase MiaA [Brevundimonas sp.]MBL0947563.1 tRNA (adenosine(37)-N6)-dimethylallyltransferase MiaA [Brevundimonas sp.]